MIIKRFSQKKGKQPKRSAKFLELDITSLLDILVILLVFLLKNFNASDLEINLMKGLKIPLSQSRKLGSNAVIVTVNNKYDLYIASKLISNLKDSDNEVIAPLYDELSKIKSEVDEHSKNIAMTDLNKLNAQKVTKVNLVFDERLPYESLRRVMHTASVAGYPEFKFIVQGNYQ
ncbi:MAG: biopolymer transporter ExbD [Bacteriovoracaceae bacterium]|nr:biopolymer transporter ExbD [Bacteriovoracaceae bacterium]